MSTEISVSEFLRSKARQHHQTRVVQVGNRFRAWQAGWQDGALRKWVDGAERTAHLGPDMEQLYRQGYREGIRAAIQADKAARRSLMGLEPIKPKPPKPVVIPSPIPQDRP